MNETSSRAHTIITINFHQKNAASKMTKMATINLVDLAGSERQSKTGATGDRFKESTHINKSLSSLGNVIKALCDIQRSKNSNLHVPYRDSNLTKLLKNSLGGNCKTTMIATISPSPYNYDETLSTLKYANRAKQIQTHAQVNESETDKLIRELMEEKERLLRDLQRYQTGANSEEVTDLKLEIQRQNDEIESLNKSWETRLQEAQKETDVTLTEFESERRKRGTTPYLWNLNEDPSLCNKIVHFLEGSMRVGNEEGTDNIVLRGPTIHSKHAVIKQDNGKISITARKGQVSVNGRQLNKDEKVRLHHDNRICFGSHCLFVVADHKKNKESTVSYELARAELAQKLLADIKAEDEYLRQQILELLPLVNEANTISERFNRKARFELLLVSGEARGLSDGRTDAYVKYVCGSSQRQLSYMWQRAKFLARHGRMMELYNEYEVSGVEAIADMPQLTDPFFESDELDCLIGLAAIPLIALTLMQPYEETISVLNYEAERVGGLEVELLPCNRDGEELDYFIDDPSELKNHHLYFKVTISKALGLPSTFFRTWCQYRFHKDNTTVSGSAVGMNPSYDFSRVISVEKGEADSGFIQYLEDGYLFIEIWGHQSMSDIQPTSVSSKDSKEIANLRNEMELLKSALRKVNEMAEAGLTALCQDNECEASAKLSEIADLTEQAT